MAAAFSATCSTVVAPNSTDATLGFAAANAMASAAGDASSSFASVRQGIGRLPRRFPLRAPELSGHATRSRAVRVLAGEDAAGEDERGDDGCSRGLEPVHGRLPFDVLAHRQAVRELSGARWRHALPARDLRRRRELPRFPVVDAPGAGLTGRDQLPDSTDDLLDGRCRAARARVDEIEMVEAHPLKRCVDLLGGGLIGPELPPELVRDHDVLALPAGRAEELAEDHLGVARPDRRFPRFVVVPGVVQEVDSVLRAARMTARPWSREIRSYVRHDPSASAETLMPDAPRGRCGRPLTCRF